MNVTQARLVLIVSGLNEISRQFHDFPAQPVGVIVVSNRSSKPGRLFGWADACEVYCRRHGLNYASVSAANLDTIGDQLREWDADLVITHSVPVLPMAVLETVAYGGINLHHSLLPAYRGGNPLLWQVIDGVEQIGLSVHRLSAEADAGDVFKQTTFTRPEGVSKRALASMANSQYGLELLKSVVSDYVEDRLQALPQPQMSPTDSANHFSLQHLLDVLSQRQVSLTGLWDIAQLFGHWPQQSLPTHGWQAWFRWLPGSIQRQCQVSHQGSVGAAYRFDSVGIHLHLRHRDGCIVFSPKVHIPTLLARLLVRR